MGVLSRDVCVCVVYGWELEKKICAAWAGGWWDEVCIKAGGGRLEGWPLRSNSSASA